MVWVSAVAGAAGAVAVMADLTWTNALVGK